MSLLLCFHSRLLVTDSLLPTWQQPNLPTTASRFLLTLNPSKSLLLTSCLHDTRGIELRVHNSPPLQTETCLTFRQEPFLDAGIGHWGLSGKTGRKRIFALSSSHVVWIACKGQNISVSVFHYRLFSYQLAHVNFGKAVSALPRALVAFLKMP